MTRAMIAYRFWHMMAAIDDALHAAGIDWIWYCQWSQLHYLDLCERLGVDVWSSFGWPVEEAQP